MGKGRDHAKWVPGWAFYKNEAILKIGKIKNSELLLKKCTDGVFKKSGSGLTVVEEKAAGSNLLEYYSELDSGVTVEYTDNIIFTLESWGQLSCKQLLETSAEILIEKAKELEALI